MAVAARRWLARSSTTRGRMTVEAATEPHSTPAPSTRERRGWIRTLLAWMAPHKAHAAVAFAVAIGGTALAAFEPLVQKIIIDDVIIHHTRALWPWLCVLGGIAVVRFGLAYLRRYRGGRISLDVQHDLRTAIFRQLQRLDFQSHDELSTGPTRVARELRRRARTEPPDVHPHRHREHRAVRPVARHHGLPVATADARAARGRAVAPLPLAEAAVDGVPRELGRAAARRRRRPSRRRVGHRRARGEGLRAGGATARAPRSRRARFVRVTRAARERAGAPVARVAGGAAARSGRRPAHRRHPGASTARSASAPSSRSPPT